MPEHCLMSNKSTPYLLGYIASGKSSEVKLIANEEVS